MTNIKNIFRTAALAAFTLVSQSAWSAAITFTSESAFQAALTGPPTLLNLDAAPLNAYPSGSSVEDAGLAADLAGLGVNFQLINAQIVDGQAFQITKPARDRLILNGDGFYGDTINSGNIALDMLVIADAFGVLTNVGDTGVIRAYSGSGLTGTLLGTVNIDTGGFGGLITSAPIGSIEVLCEGGDKKCGLYDMQYGVAVVPVPAAVWLFGSGLLALTGFKRRCRRA